MRLFVGIKLSATVNVAVASAIAGMRARADDHNLKASWIPEENLHLTLKFLGSTDHALVERIKAELDQAAITAAPFKLEARGTGAFPPRGRPRVLWVGLTDPTNALAQIAAAVEERLTPLGFKPESRQFSAHLTVARVKDGRNAKTVLSPYENTSFGISTIDRLMLFESVTKPSGAVYSVVSEHILSG